LYILPSFIFQRACSAQGAQEVISSLGARVSNLRHCVVSVKTRSPKWGMVVNDRRWLVRMSHLEEHIQQTRRRVFEWERG